MSPADRARKLLADKATEYEGDGGLKTVDWVYVDWCPRVIAALCDKLEAAMWDRDALQRELNARVKP